MNYIDEIECDGEIYISYLALSVKKKVDMEILKYILQAKIDVYVYEILQGYKDGIGSYTNPNAGKPWKPQDLKLDTYKAVIRRDYDPLFPNPREWNYIYFSKKELERYELIPSADDARKGGLSKAIKESMERTLQATYQVGKWIGEAGLQPGGITKIKVQDFLGRNDFGFGETALFKDVWKAIPHSDKSTGGRPPNK